MFDPMFDSGSFEFGEWQARVLAGNIVFWANVCPAMWSLLMRISGAISSLPKGKRGLDREPTAEELTAAVVAGVATELEQQGEGMVAAAAPASETLRLSQDTADAAPLCGLV